MYQLHPPECSWTVEGPRPKCRKRYPILPKDVLGVVVSGGSPWRKLPSRQRNQIIQKEGARLYFAIGSRNSGCARNRYIYSCFGSAVKLAMFWRLADAVRQTPVLLIRVHLYPLELPCRRMSPSDMQLHHSLFGVGETPTAGAPPRNSIAGRESLRGFGAIEPALCGWRLKTASG